MTYQRATLEKAEKTHRVSAKTMAAEKKARLAKTDQLRQARLNTLAQVLQGADKP